MRKQILRITGGCTGLAPLPDFPEVRISTDRLDIREFSPADIDRAAGTSRM